MLETKNYRDMIMHVLKPKNVFANMNFIYHIHMVL
jgi:hypothetical protein